MIGRVAVASLALAAASPAYAFDPIAFFSGSSHGVGRLHQIFQPGRAVLVESVGREERDGILILKQRVAIDGKAARDRVWRLKRTTGDRYSGTLTDAVGPIRAVASGNTVHISYRMKGKLDVDQMLTLLPGGRVVDNRMIIRKWGLRVASLTERIEKD